MKIKLILTYVLAFFTIFSGAVYAQDFTFLSDDTLQSGEVGVLNTFHANLTNNSASLQLFTCELDTSGYPSDWFYSWCIGPICLPPFIFVSVDTLEAGGVEEFTIYLTPNSNQESGSVMITVYPEGSPSLAQSLTFTVNFGSSVENHPAQSFRGFELGHAYPNPFNPSTQIDLHLAQAGLVDAAVYNIMGRKVGILHYGRLAAGDYSLAWDGRFFGRKDLPSGVYFFHVKAGDISQTAKVVKLK